MRLYYWLEALTLGSSPLGTGGRVISRFDGLISTKPLTHKCGEGECMCEWPGEQVGTAELHVAEGSGYPEAVHVLAHYHDNYFDCVYVFTDLKEAKDKFIEEQRELWQRIEANYYDPPGNGVVKMSKYHCSLVSFEDGVFQHPDKGSTWMLLPYTLVES